MKGVYVGCLSFTQPAAYGLASVGHVINWLLMHCAVSCVGDIATCRYNSLLSRGIGTY